MISGWVVLETFQILRRVRLRVRHFLNTKYCTRVNQRQFGGKTWQPSSFYYEFSRECRGGENKISNAKSFIILPLGERVPPFTKDNNANFSSEKWQNEAFRGVYILRRHENTSAQISYSQSSSSSYLKVSNVMLRGNLRRKRFVASVADVIYSRLVTSTKQRPNPRSGPPTDSTNYRKSTMAF